MMFALAVLTLASPASAATVVDDGHGVHAILSVTPFTVTTPYKYEFSAEHPNVKSGLILVLDSDPIWLIPSDSKQAVLYVGDQPVEKVNKGFPDGRLIVIVPAGWDLTRVPIYYGGYELPETVTAQMGKDTLVQARKQGLAPILNPPTPLPNVTVADHAELLKVAAAIK